jgi:hypothetical protein
MQRPDPTEAMAQICDLPHVVGAALDRRGDLVIFLDGDHCVTRGRLKDWALARNIHVEIKVTGTIVSG